MQPAILDLLHAGPGFCHLGCRPRTRTASAAAPGENGKLQHATGVASVGLICNFLVVQPANGVTRGWHPRRHHRRLGEKWLTKLYTQEADRRETVKKAWTEKQRKKASQRFPAKQEAKAKEIFLSASAPPTPQILERPSGRPSYFYGSQPTQFAGMGLYALVGGILVLVLFFWKRILHMWNRMSARFGNNRHRQGKWVYDRSMGGRKIFIPKDETAIEAAMNPLAESPAPKEPTRVKLETNVYIPTWWELPASLYVPQNMKGKSIALARKLMMQLENSKVAGQDFSLDVMLQLYRTCESGGIVASGNSDNITASVYRKAVDFAVEKATIKNGTLGRIRPRSFVAGFSKYLMIEESKALTIVKGAVASQCRSLLVEMAADFRAKGISPWSISPAATSLNHLCSEFPVSGDSGHLQVISLMLDRALSLEEKRQIFDYFRENFPSNAHVVKNMLGLPASPPNV